MRELANRELVSTWLILLLTNLFFSVRLGCTRPTNCPCLELDRITDQIFSLPSATLPLPSYLQTLYTFPFVFPPIVLYSLSSVYVYFLLKLSMGIALSTYHLNIERLKWQRLILVARYLMTLHLTDINALGSATVSLWFSSSVPELCRFRQYCDL